MIITNLNINQPLTNKGFISGQSVLPERLRSISAPSQQPIVNDDLNSVTHIKRELTDSEECLEPSSPE